MTSIKLAGSRILLSLLGIATLVFAFQNCGPTGFNTNVYSSVPQDTSLVANDFDPESVDSESGVDEVAAVGYGKEVIIRNQFGRILIKPILTHYSTPYDYTSGPSHDILSYELNIGALMAGVTSGGLQFFSVPGGGVSYRIHSISTIPGDFSENAICKSRNHTSEPSLRATINGTSVCNLDPKKIYYLNIKSMDHCPSLSYQCYVHAGWGLN